MENIIVGVIALLLFAYLLVAMLRPEKFYDLVVQVAIVRPGPIAGKMAHPYLKRRQGSRAARPTAVLDPDWGAHRTRASTIEKAVVVGAIRTISTPLCFSS